MTEVRYVRRVPTESEFYAVRSAVGWETAGPQAVVPALRATLFAVCAEAAGRTVGMGRVIGDGLYFHVQDVVVVPEFQSRGIGTRMMRDICRWLDENSPPGAYVALSTDPAVVPFYERLGFVRQSSAVLRKG
ncbi:GNAT family N-acetyltransferase [Streptomyces xiamenensis]